MMAFWDIGPCILIFDPEGEYSALSNYAESRIEALDAVWPTAEHLYQAQKFVSLAHRERIRTASSAAAAKALAWGELTGFVRPDWDSARVEAMNFALRNKVLQNPDISILLCESFPLPIAEDSERDSFWGIGSGLGQNQLGRLLEAIRAEVSGLPGIPVTVTPLVPFVRSVESRIAAVLGEYRIAPVIRTLPAEYLGASSLGMSIEELLRQRLGFEPINSLCSIDDASGDVMQFHSRSEAFNRALASAFDAKYADYCWEGDARSAVTRWPDRFLNLLDRLMSKSGIEVVRGLVIGAGAGEEAANLWARFRGQLTLVDIGPHMVQNSKRQVPSAASICARAEDLQILPSASHDFYCALRVYQSLYFDFEMAIGEAFRVLRPGGLFLVSVSDAYLSSTGRVERGQITGNVIDNTLALNTACRVAKLLNRMGFSGLGFADLTTELVVFGRKIATEAAE